MSKSKPEPRLVASEAGRVIHDGWMDYFGTYNAQCGTPGLFMPVQGEATCKRCRKMAQEATNEHHRDRRVVR